MRLTRAAAWALAAVLAVPVLPAAPARAAEGYPCDGIDPDTERSATTLRNVPYGLLDVDRAVSELRRRGRVPGEGVVVAVVDSGVSAPEAMATLTVSGVERFGTGKPVLFGHGTNVAGLVAGGRREEGGPTGIAPGAEIFDVRVYDEAGENGVGGIPPENVVAALEWLADNAGEEGIGVVVMAFTLPDSPALRRAVAALSERDVVIVTGSGNRPSEEGQAGFEEYGTLRPGEDVAGEYFPAAYAEDVFAMTATGDGLDVAAGEVPDASASVLQSSDIDAAVPTYGAVTLAPNGATCLLPDVATSWAAGIGAGVVALVRSAYPRENATQIEARLKATASGSADAPNAVVGHGVLQPVEALTRRLRPTRTGEVDDMPREEPASTRVSAPPAEPDPLAATLADARWWGLFGGAALVLALLVRPLLRRRTALAEQAGHWRR